MGLFFERRGQTGKTPLEQANSLYHMGRHSLLFVIGFTLINIVMIMVNGGYYILFSATLPYAMTCLGALMTGRLPAEAFFTQDVIQKWLAELPNLGENFYNTLTMGALLLQVVYFVLWLLSKKHRVGWLIAAAALFVLDTVAMFLFYGLSGAFVLEYLFHGWVLLYLIRGVAAYYRWSALAEEQGIFPGDE